MLLPTEPDIAPFRLPFIAHRQAEHIYTYAHDVVRSRHVGIVLDAGGADAENTLRFWSSGNATGVRANRIIAVSAHSRSKRSYRHSGGLDYVTLTLFSRLRYMLEQAGQPQYVSPYKMRRGERIESLHTPSQFNALFDRVQAQMEVRQQAIVIVFGARHLTTRAWRELHYLRDEMPVPFGILLSTELAKDEQPDEPLRHILVQHGASQDDDDDSPAKYPRTLSPLVATPPERSEYIGTVLPNVFKALGVRFSPFVMRHIGELIATLWQNTHGNWHLTHTVATEFDLALGGNEQTRRLVTKATVQRVYRRLNWQLPSFVQLDDDDTEA